jgi:hypothetical protein
MVTRVRLRIELPDEPGSLGRVASVLGGLGGNVVGIDIQEEVDGAASVDEVVVDLPDGIGPEDVRAALVGAGAGRLLSVHWSRPHGDTALRALEWVDELLTLDPRERDGALAAALADLCGATGAWVATSLEEAREHDAGRHALERGAPTAQRTDHVPPALRDELADGAWLLAVPDDPQAPFRIAFLARPLTSRFTATEIARVTSLLRTCRRLDAAPVAADRLWYLE